MKKRVQKTGKTSVTKFVNSLKYLKKSSKPHWLFEKSQGTTEG